MGSLRSFGISLTAVFFLIVVIVLIIYGFNWDGSDSKKFRFAESSDEDLASIYPQDAASRREVFRKFTGLKVPQSDHFKVNDITKMAPLASVMPHITNLTLRAELGRSTWHLIHTMGNSYPLEPTSEEKFAIISFIRLLGLIYPCGECAEHFREKLKLHPPEPHVSSRTNLTAYLCRMHNKVNMKLGKPIFDCGEISDRWNCGCGHTDDPDAKKQSSGDDDDDGEDDLEALIQPDGTTREFLPGEKKLKMERRSLFKIDYDVYLKRNVTGGLKKTPQRISLFNV